MSKNKSRASADTLDAADIDSARCERDTPSTVTVRDPNTTDTNGVDNKEMIKAAKAAGAAAKANVTAEAEGAKAKADEAAARAKAKAETEPVKAAKTKAK